MNNYATTSFLSFLYQEARALLTRLDRIKPFSLQTPMVPAANISQEALLSIEKFLSTSCSDLRKIVLEYIKWLSQFGNNKFSGRIAQQKFTVIRLQFNNILSQVDIFADVLNQRSEHETGVWISSLDVAAADAIKLPGNYYYPPPLICYLDRGHGAAIRRVRTRLPGGKPNPVAIIRVPRERMVGSGIASSLFHEVGHQGAALLDLVNSIRPVLVAEINKRNDDRLAWICWERWISEIISDFWSVSKLGITSTLGLIGVVSLPRAFVFRIMLNDPHPFPWIRVKLSCAMGNMLYPHPQWERLSQLWNSLYPIDEISKQKKKTIKILIDNIPAFISKLIFHRPKSLNGKSLGEVFSLGDRQPSKLKNYLYSGSVSKYKMLNASPSLVFAVIGQARADGKITPEKESEILAKVFNHWALKSTFNTSENNSRRLLQSSTNANKLMLI